MVERKAGWQRSQNDQERPQCFTHNSCRLPDTDCWEGHVNQIELPMAGGCQCERQRYSISTLPLTLYACHCTDCQTQSTSAFGMSMPVPREAVNCDFDRLGTWERTAESGRIVKARYCRDCGTRLFHEPSRNRNIINVKPGTLDDTSWLKPVGHLWLGSAQSWFVPPEYALRYQGQPAAFDELFERFKDNFGHGDLD